MTMGATAYTRAIADEICQRLAAGEGLRALCREEAMPPRRTVQDWVKRDVDGFAARYARAREAGVKELLATYWNLPMTGGGHV